MQHLQHIMLYYFKKGKNTTETTKKDWCSVWRRYCDLWNVSKWFAKFHAGGISPDDTPHSGGPVQVDGDQIETLTENNQCYTMRKIANILKISKSIKLLVKMKTVSFILQKKLNKLFGQPNKHKRLI